MLCIDFDGLPAIVSVKSTVIAGHDVHSAPGVDTVQLPGLDQPPASVGRDTGTGPRVVGQAAALSRIETIAKGVIPTTRLLSEATGGFHHFALVLDLIRLLY